MSNRFYLACTRNRVGSNEGFWAIDGAGYTTNLDHAHVYTLEEAQEAWNKYRVIEQPLCADQVDALAIWKVDYQYIPQTTTLTNSDEYVAYTRNRHDGNDVYWLTDLRESLNFSEAKRYNKITASGNQDNNLVFIPFDIANSKKRRTFDYNLINHRKMITSVGLITPEHIKRYRRRKPVTGKVRFNCPSCGKINWQYNPEYFEGCSHCYY